MSNKIDEIDFLRYEAFIGHTHSDGFEVGGADFRSLNQGLALKREDRDKREDSDKIHPEHQRRSSENDNGSLK